MRQRAPDRTREMMARDWYWVTGCTHCRHPAGGHLFESGRCQICPECPGYSDGGYIQWSDQPTAGMLEGKPRDAAEPDSRPRSTIVGVRLSAEELAVVRAVADRDGVTFASALREGFMRSAQGAQAAPKET
jgi:hypothetical protein